MEIASELPQFQPGFASQEIEERLANMVKAVDQALSEVDPDLVRQGNGIRTWTL